MLGKEFKGVYTALVTPFLENGKVNEETLRKLVDLQIEGGVQGLVPMGTTGESPSLNHEEHIDVISIVIDQCKGKIPVIAGTGSNSTEEAINLTAKAKQLGASASLQVAPYYNKPTQEGLYQHFSKIAEEIDLPHIVYNIPGRSGVNITNDTMLRLAKHKNIVAVKDATGNLNQMMDLVSRKPDDLVILSGDDNLCFPIITLGGSGVISVASNIVPGKMVELVNASLNGDNEKAKKLHYELLPLLKVLFIETNPIPIKAIMALKGLIKEIYRLPMCPLSKENKEKLTSVINSINL